MLQKILEARIEYTEDGYISRVTVLVEMSRNDIRAISASTEPMSGFTHILAQKEIKSSLLQDVANYGMEIIGMDKNRIFPKWKRFLK